MTPAEARHDHPALIFKALNDSLNRFVPKATLTKALPRTVSYGALFFSGATELSVPARNATGSNTLRRIQNLFRTQLVRL